MVKNEGNYIIKLIKTLIKSKLLIMKLNACLNISNLDLMKI